MVRGAALAELVPAVRPPGCTVLAADGGGEVALDAAADDGLLAGPVALAVRQRGAGPGRRARRAADARVRIPMRGRAESLNLAVAAAICLYATQLAQG